MTNVELAHVGVKGMKWGVRKDDSAPSARSQRKAAKKAEWDEHDRNVMGARERQAGRVKELDQLAARTYSATSELGRARATVAYNKLQTETLTGLDAQAAQVLTRGERRATQAIAAIGLVAMAAGFAASVTKP